MSMMHWAGVAAGFLIALGVGLLLVVFYIRSRQDAAPPPARTGEMTRAAADVRKLMDELEALARRIDERIERRLTELRHELAKADAFLKASGPAGSPAREPQESHDATGVADSGGTAPPAADTSAARPEDREILRLHAQGLDPIEIARRRQMPVGEVELILNLHLPRQRAR